ncbi:MAG: amidohydrolase family protein [Lentisphaeria bacterium]|nr:amidohydrolase family protein [Lentisphaeria bacterium]
MTRSSPDGAGESSVAGGPVGGAGSAGEVWSLPGDRELFDREFSRWLPESILDAHVHVFEKGCLPAGFRFAAENCYTRFGGEHTLEQCLSAAACLLPGRRFGMLSFGTPHAAVDREAAARYTGSTVDNRTRFGLALVAPEDDASALADRVRRHGLVGLKPYRNYVSGLAPEAVRIPDMLTPVQLEMADGLGLAITLHIPKAARLADADNQRDLVALCRTYPRIQVIVAHIGRAYWLSNVVGHLDGPASCPNLWLDTAMVNHAGVLEYAFRHFPRERILFGSDAPIAWLRGKSVEVNGQYAYLMGEPYRIGSSIYDADHVVSFTYFYYEMLRAVKEAALRVGWGAGDLEGFFHGHAERLLGSVARGLYGGS